MRWRYRRDTHIQQHGDQRQQQGRDAKRGKTPVLMQHQAYRRTGRQRAIDRHAGPGHDLAGTGGPHQAKTPGQGTGQQQAFAVA
ncbi:hypothetical protein D3C79_841440 [compost metagenome]